MVHASYTTQELMAQIKGWEYLIVVLFIGMTLLFWRLLARERRGHSSGGDDHATAESGKTQRMAVAGGTSGSKQAYTQGYWEFHKSALQGFEACEGYQHSSLPCWLVRPMVEGGKVAGCSRCPIAAQGMKHLVEAARSRSGMP